MNNKLKSALIVICCCVIAAMIIKLLIPLYNQSDVARYKICNGTKVEITNDVRGIDNYMAMGKSTRI
jgi:hypothetical protein